METRQQSDYIINVTDLTKESDRLILGLFLCSENIKSSLFGESFFPAETSLPLQLKDGIEKLAALGITPPESIILSHQLVKDTDSERVTYHVYGKDKLGEGNHGEVYPIIGKLSLMDDRSAAYKSHHKHVTKQMLQFSDGERFEPFEYFKQRALKEYLLLSRSNKYGVKRPVFIRVNAHQFLAIMLMRRIEGQNIEKILDLDREDPTFMSVDQRLQMTWQVALELNMLHKKDILHRDYKHANVMYDFEMERATAVDLGLSCDKSDMNLSPVGTPLYSPAERLEAKPGVRKLTSPLTEASDRYNLGWLVALIWRAHDNPAQEWDEALVISLNCIFIDLFKDISDNELSPPHKERLSTLIHSLVKRIPAERLSLDEFILGVEQIWLDRKLENTDNSLHSTIRAAHNSGVTLRKRLDIFNGMIEKESLTRTFYFEGIIKLFNQALQDVSDTPDAIATFLHPLNSQFLKNLTHKDEVFHAVSSLLQSYIHKETIAKNLGAIINGAVLQQPALSYTDLTIRYNKFSEIAKNINALFETQSCGMTLDEISKDNKICEKKLSQYKREFDKTVRFYNAKQINSQKYNKKNIDSPRATQSYMPNTISKTTPTLFNNKVHPSASSKPVTSNTSRHTFLKKGSC